MFLFLSPLFVNFNAICLECIEDGVIKCIGYYSPFFILDDGVLREESIFYNCAHKILRAFFFCEFSICRGGGGMKGKKKLTGRVRRGDSVYRASEIRREHELTC